MEPKKVLLFLGSPRKNGNSTILAHKVAEGVKAAGGEAESFYLHGMDIAACKACNACRRTAESSCIIDDDMQEIYHKLPSADAFIIASPVYWFTVSAQVKLFMDRWFALGGENGYALKGIPAAAILTYGDADAFSSGAVNAMRTLQDAFNYIGIPSKGFIHGSAYEAGEISADRRLLEKAFQLGKQLVEQV
ncbi:MAG: flavodoxin family protein [bacterium]|nr:flavodoxin family protein [bacterium]